MSFLTTWILYTGYYFLAVLFLAIFALLTKGIYALVFRWWFYLSTVIFCVNWWWTIKFRWIKDMQLIVLPEENWFLSLVYVLPDVLLIVSVIFIRYYWPSDVRLDYRLRIMGNKKALKRVRLKLDDCVVLVSREVKANP